MNEVKELRQEYERRKGRREQVEAVVARVEKAIAKLETEAEDLKEAQDIIQTTAQATQKELEYHISELVSLALEAVFPDPYRLNLDFELRRNKSEADLTFSKKKGDKIDPLSASGGGAVDVAAFGLRVSLWSLRGKRSRPCIVLDEPFRFLSRGLQEKASRMLKEISDRLGIQFIIVTHEQNLEESADRVFEAIQRKRMTKVSYEKEID